MMEGRIEKRGGGGDRGGLGGGRGRLKERVRRGGGWVAKSPVPRSRREKTPYLTLLAIL